jgi:hypothetical protein
LTPLFRPSKREGISEIEQVRRPAEKNLITGLSWNEAGQMPVFCCITVYSLPKVIFDYVL